MLCAVGLNRLVVRCGGGVGEGGDESGDGVGLGVGVVGVVGCVQWKHSR